jgi:hypothetical protein
VASQYIILRNSVEQAAWDALTPEEQLDPAHFQGKKFAVVMQNYAPGLSKGGTERETIGGVIDVSEGNVFWQWRGIIFVKYDVEDAEQTAGYGTYADLEDYFKLNNPHGSPSNVITLIDHYGVAHTGYIRTKEHVPTPLTQMIDGEYAMFTVPLQFLEREKIG